MVDLPPLNDYLTDKDNFNLAIPETFNFGFDVIDKRAQEADKTAFIYVTRDGEKIEHHRFSDLSRASNRFANVLLSMGAKKGDLALTIIPRIPAWYHVTIGCIKAGVVAMPGTNLLTAKDIEYRLNKSRAKLAIVTQEHAQKVEDILSKCPALEHLIIIGEPRDGWVSFEEQCQAHSEILNRESVEATGAEEAMLIYFTSGTTSFPKMVPREHSYALAHIITGHYWMDLKPEDIHWSLTDTGWAKAAWGMLFPQWLMGTTIVLYDADAKFDAHRHLTLMERLGVTTFCAPPTVYRLFAQVDLGQHNLSSLRHSFSAGEPLNPEVIQVWEKATGTLPHDGYGQTETINIVANYPGVNIRPGSMGKPVPGLNVQIVNDEGSICPINEIGSIAVKITEPYPPGLFRGYFEDPQANKTCFRNGWYYTGDTAKQDEDGYFWFVGRTDDIITSSGYRISPFEVESVLLEHPAIAEAAVVGKPDALRGEIVKAFAILAPGHSPTDLLKQEIQAFVKNQTAPYKYPREIEFREELPKTISGKIRRIDLRTQSDE
jgi:acetyl-CoA synthetase